MTTEQSLFPNGAQPARKVMELRMYGFNENTVVEHIAKVCHEVNRAYCHALGDTSQPHWHAAPEWQRQSAVSGVRFHLVHPNVTPAESHANWLAEKLRDGWTYGPTKDPVAKTHPCCVPYDQLPVEQRAKDYLFKAIVSALA